MGCGCTKADQVTALHTSAPSREPKTPRGSFKALVQLAGVPHRDLTAAKLDSALSLLSTVESDASRSWFKNWASSAASNSQVALLTLMQKAVDRAFDSSVTIAEELVQSENTGVGDTPRVGHIISLVKESIGIQSCHQAGVSLAMHVISDSFARQSLGSSFDYVVPCLDRLVLLFRPSLLDTLEDSTENLLQWRDFISGTGLPPLEQHLSLLSHGSKATLLSLTLVTEDAPALQLVTKREAPLLQIVSQLPLSRACVLKPYFENPAGSKIVDDKRVEGGEGHGPRKEFFVASSADALKKWKDVEISTTSDSGDQESQISFVDSRIVVSHTVGSRPASPSVAGAQKALISAMRAARVGDRLQLGFSDGTAVEHIITGIHGETGVKTNRSFDALSVDDSMLSSCILQRSVKPLFEFHRGTGKHWFSPYASDIDGSGNEQDLRNRFQGFGKLLLLALVNRCKISFALPDMFFHLLLSTDFKPTIDDFKDFDAELYASLQKCEKMSSSQFNSLKELEGLPEQVTRQQYIREKVKEVFDPEAIQEVRKGFWSLCTTPWLAFNGVAAKDLSHALCPQDDLVDELGMRDIFKVEMEEEMASEEIFVNAFWSVVDGLPQADKKLFVRFVTGVDSLPEPGTERLIIELPFSGFTTEETIAMLDLLPQAHTCSNTLELPNYFEALKESPHFTLDEKTPEFSAELSAIMRNKLLVAIRETSGYELDTVPDTLAMAHASPAVPAQASSRSNPDAIEVVNDAATAPHVPHVTAMSQSCIRSPARSKLSSDLHVSGAASTMEPKDDLQLDLGHDCRSSDVDTFLAELELGLESDFVSETLS